LRSIRTDLAAEAVSRHISGDVSSIDGIETEVLYIHGIRVERVSILTDDAAELVGKPTGKYLTIDMDKYVNRRDEAFTDSVMCISELLRSFHDIERADTFLVACLGNRNITPDALGPYAADSILVTRHLKKLISDEFYAFSSVSVVRTGVLGTTGLESCATVSALCPVVRPDCVIVIDALASSELSRLCRTVQICDSGISPGSGVGNNRAAINSECLGVPVIAIGVPTVIDASCISDDDDANGFFVTPRSIDELVMGCAKLIAYGINLALHKDLTIADIDGLIE